MDCDDRRHPPYWLALPGKEQNKNELIMLKYKPESNPTIFRKMDIVSGFLLSGSAIL